MSESERLQKMAEEMLMVADELRGLSARLAELERLDDFRLAEEARLREEVDGLREEVASLREELRTAQDPRWEDPHP